MRDHHLPEVAEFRELIGLRVGDGVVSVRGGGHLRAVHLGGDTFVDLQLRHPSAYGMKVSPSSRFMAKPVSSFFCSVDVQDGAAVRRRVYSRTCLRITASAAGAADWAPSHAAAASSSRTERDRRFGMRLAITAPPPFPAPGSVCAPRGRCPAPA